jgi:DNA-binding transcriptional LysR family regulator
MSNNVDYNDLTVFVRVVDAGSFTQGARALGVPKSSVTRSIARLERTLGVRLLQRTTRQRGVTDAGRALYDRIRGALSAVDEATSAVRELGSEPSGLVRLTAPSDSAMAATLARIIHAFLERHPRIQVEVSLSGRTVDMVAEGFDLAVRAGPLADSSLVARRILVGTLAPFAARAYLERRKRPRRLADLANHDCVLFRAHGGRTTWRLSGKEGMVSVDVTGTITTDDMSFLVSMVRLGRGIALLPVEVVGAVVPRGELVRLFPDYGVPGAILSIVMPSAAYVPSRVALLRDFLVEHLARELGSSK